MGNIGQNYSLHSIPSAYNTLNSNNSVEKHTAPHLHDYTNLAGKSKTKTFTCDWCSGKYEGEPAYRCGHNHVWGDKKLCSYECYQSHWSSAHM